MADNHNNSCASIAQSQASNLELINNLVQCINLAQDLAIETELEFKKLLQQLQQIDMQTEAAAKTAFLDNMRHKFITPLAGILNLAEVLEKQEKDSKRQEYLYHIRLAGSELLDMFKKLLEFESISSGKYPVTITTVNISNIIDKVRKLMGAAVDLKKLKLIIEIDKEVPKFIKTDKFRLQMILINLVSNAIGFTEKGYIKISVKMPIKNVGKLLLVVEDSGAGFDMKSSKYILEAFNKLTPAYKSQDEGLGIGLTIVQTFLQELNGCLHISSQVGKGSCFECILPIKQE